MHPTAQLPYELKEKDELEGEQRGGERRPRFRRRCFVARNGVLGAVKALNGAKRSASPGST
jgi:hypothetical protein